MQWFRFVFIREFLFVSFSGLLLGCLNANHEIARKETPELTRSKTHSVIDF